MNLLTTFTAPRQTVHSFRPRPIVRATALWCIAAALSSSAWPSTPGEKVVCTDAPRSTWLSEGQARTVFQTDRYVLVRFKVSRGNCHEFYAIEPGGAVVESYQHPVTGHTVRSTRIPPPGSAASAPTSTSTPTATNAVTLKPRP
jgi:hypothetical protein